VSEPAAARERVPVAELIDVDRVGPGHRPPTPAELRAALPRGWVLEDDLVTARRDLRMVFREGWILILGLVCFGAVGLGLLFHGFPRGGAGLLRFAVLVGAVLLAGGLVAPRITRALHARSRPRGGPRA
jgi:hypothetical protein